MAERFDVVVLGGGPGGYAAALYGAAAGLRIAMVEETRVGGTCLHRGCIPAKELLQTAEVLRTVRTAKEFGVDAGQPTLDLPTSQARKQQVVDRLTKGLESLLKGRKVTVVPGHRHDRRRRRPPRPGLGRLRADRRRADPRDRVAARASCPASRSTATHVLSSDHVLELDEVPARTAIIGGGAIGCEFASFLADVGSEVTLLEALPAILPGVDKQAADQVVRAFKKRGIKVVTGVAVEGVDRRPALAVRVPCRATRRESLEVDKVVVSVGRRPRSEGIGLEGVRRRGRRPRLRRRRRPPATSVPGVYAVGDVVAGPALAHVGFAEAIVAIKTILGEDADPASTTTRCRGASTATPRSRSAGSPRRRPSSAATTSSRRCTGSAATAAR